MARIWDKGAGGQCASKAAEGCGGLCKTHFNQQSKPGWHGSVDGPIPEAKLKEFQKAAARKAPRGSPALQGSAAGAGRAQADERAASDDRAGPDASMAAGGRGVGAVDSVGAAEGPDGRTILAGRIVGPLASSSAASAKPRGGAPRIVTGFGAQRVEGSSLGEIEGRTDAEQCQRARERREQGGRGGARDLQGNELDRGAGAAWRAGK